MLACAGKLDFESSRLLQEGNDLLSVTKSIDIEHVCWGFITVNRLWYTWCHKEMLLITCHETEFLLQILKDTLGVKVF